MVGEEKDERAQIHWIPIYTRRAVFFSLSLSIYSISIHLLTLNLLGALNLQIRNPQHRIPMLALDRPHPPVPPLRLLLGPQRLRLDTHNRRAALKQPLVNGGDVLRAAGLVGALGQGAVARPEGVVAGTQHRRAVEPQHVAGDHARHQKGQADRVAGGDEVRTAVDVDGDVVRGLRAQERQELLDGLWEGTGGWWGCGRAGCRAGC